MKQLSFLPELDRRKTQKAVEKKLEDYRLCKYLAFEEREASTIAGYTERFHGSTNVTSDQTASIAIHNVDMKSYQKNYCEWIERAVKRLHPKERLLIEARYMREDYDGDYVKDYQVYNFVFNPPISAATYDKIRWKAFYKLALFLNVAVEKTTE
ncbi:ArpU family phage packaging/lysis transcriptional regulator [Brevibacillus laterosporus]|uniref:Transcriptional regulator n=1 Tax=Brevibacillus laterosporus TaxID=1465 RepID=A0A0F6XYV8_BRELA|nr:transcriptional regulator [Brevibacillus laterosporus]